MILLSIESMIYSAVHYMLHKHIRTTHTHKSPKALEFSFWKHDMFWWWILLVLKGLDDEWGLYHVADASVYEIFSQSFPDAEDLIERSNRQSNLKSSTSGQIVTPKPELRTFWGTKSRTITIHLWISQLVVIGRDEICPGWYVAESDLWCLASCSACWRSNSWNSRIRSRRRERSWLAWCWWWWNGWHGQKMWGNDFCGVLNIQK